MVSEYLNPHPPTTELLRIKQYIPSGGILRGKGRCLKMAKSFERSKADEGVSADEIISFIRRANVWKACRRYNCTWPTMRRFLESKGESPDLGVPDMESSDTSDLGVAADAIILAFRKMQGEIDKAHVEIARLNEIEERYNEIISAKQQDVINQAFGLCEICEQFGKEVVHR